MPPPDEAAAFLQAHGAEFVGLVTSGVTGASAALMAALPQLRVVSSFGVGFDKIDVAHAQSRGIPVGITPGVLNDCVADLAFALMLAVARGVSASDRFVRRGDWLKGRFPLATKVSGKRIGILGLGRIGQAIAWRAAGFDMEVGYHNRSRPPDAGFTYLPPPHRAGGLRRLSGGGRGRWGSDTPPGVARGAGRAGPARLFDQRSPGLRD